MEVLAESGFCPSTGIYHSKWVSPLLPHNPCLSLPSFLLSPLPPQILCKPAFIDSTTGRSVTYGEFRSLIVAAACTLRTLGVKKGDVVLVVSPNFLHFPLLVLGVMYLGAIFSTANPLHTRPELESQIQDSKPILILTTQELKPKLDGLISGPLLMTQSFIDDVLNHSSHHPYSCESLNVSIRQQDTAALMYSSGTTGKSKAVVCSHGNLIAMSCLLRHVWDAKGEACNDVYMCVVPLFHMFGLSMFVCGVLAVRSTAVILKKYSIEEMLVAVEEYRVTRLPVVPPIVVQLVRLSYGTKLIELGSLKELICSGAPLGKDYMDRFSKCYPHIILSQCYGLTETNGPITLCNGVSGRLHVSIGRLIPCVEAKIVDVQTGKPLPPLKYGELHLRGPPIMQGYLKNEEATSLTIDEEGWLHTGDLCFIDQCGLVYILDRIKELIKYKAFQVAPAELEEILLSHPEINDAAVIPYPDEEAGEIPMACVVRREASKVREAEIINFIASKVAHYKRVRKVVFVESIPRSPSGKILRRQLRALSDHQRLEISSRL
ncbi:probable CoA ligase CCL5 [Telopea speciosissima]|uniref:probable CoA ligase CCL5 n=1 Tax=Telopea speciosissima TaxID=54955 RepID=UPI001CC452CA|nr:probable CoA ligase CCL5 [Telopea speciosissima]XP_043706095.1 probable CoA ligase CCL5 [Telopea speciosissima]